MTCPDAPPTDHLACRALAATIRDLPWRPHGAVVVVVSYDPFAVEGTAYTARISHLGNLAAQAREHASPHAALRALLALATIHLESGVPRAKTP